MHYYYHFNRSKWNANKFFQGAYSFRAIESDSIAGDICAALCDPVVFEDEHGERVSLFGMGKEECGNSKMLIDDY